MNKTKKIFIISVFFYAIAFVLMALGTVYDLQISKAIFNPQSNFAIYLEAFGQVVYWGMWGPLFTVLFLTRHSLFEFFEIIGSIFPFINFKPNFQSKAYKAFNFIFKNVFAAAFLILSVVGWRKLVANVLNDFFDWSELIYYIISAVIAALGIFAFSRMSKQTLKKLEYLALAGLLLGVIFKITEELKTVTHRVRFREMVAYSNGLLSEKGMSEGKTVKLQAPLNSSMAANTDFSAFLPWYKIAEKSTIYSHADSFPSGHTSYSCTVFLSVLLAEAFEKLKKATPFLLAFSFCYVFLMAASRMTAGAHYLTDVTFGAIVGYTGFLAAAAVYKKFVKQNHLGTLD